jgi:hypothetical protein
MVPAARFAMAASVLFATAAVTRALRPTLRTA